MESTYKTRLSSEQLDAIIEQHFSASIEDYKEMVDGWANHAYLITLSDEQRVVLKIAPSASTNLMRCEQDLMIAEVEALRLITELQDVPVPQVLAYDDSLTMASARYFIMEYMSGAPYNQVKDQYSAEEQEAIEHQLGRYNRRINEIKGSSLDISRSKNSVIPHGKKHL